MTYSPLSCYTSCQLSAVCRRVTAKVNGNETAKAIQEALSKAQRRRAAETSKGEKSVILIICIF